MKRVQEHSLMKQRVTTRSSGPLAEGPLSLNVTAPDGRASVVEMAYTAACQAAGSRGPSGFEPRHSHSQSGAVILGVAQ